MNVRVLTHLIHYTFKSSWSDIKNLCFPPWDNKHRETRRAKKSPHLSIPKWNQVWGKNKQKMSTREKYIRAPLTTRHVSSALYACYLMQAGKRSVGSGVGVMITTFFLKYQVTITVGVLCSAVAWISNTVQISRSKDEAMKVPNQDLSERARAYSISEFFCIGKLQKQ